MRFERQLTKDGKCWLVEIPAFDASVYPRSGELFEVGGNRVAVLETS